MDFGKKGMFWLSSLFPKRNGACVKTGGTGKMKKMFWGLLLAVCVALSALPALADTTYTVTIKTDGHGTASDDNGATWQNSITVPVPAGQTLNDTPRYQNSA